MISIVICSKNPVLLKNVRENISETVGVPFEIVYRDNKENQGICSVYNQLAQQTKYPYLCFLHEDVMIKTRDWGKKLIEIFHSDPSIALIGIAGCKYKSAYFSGWFSNVKELDCANYTHQYKDGIEKVHLSPQNDNRLQDVVCIDGVFMCCKKEAWLQDHFDDEFLKGFHFYDIDFSLRIARKNRVVVSYDIELVHITSGGDYGNNWVQIAMLYHMRMKPSLPFSKIAVDQKKADRKLIIATMDFLKNYSISFRNKVKWITLQKLYFSPVFFYSILKFFFIQLVRTRKLH